LERGRALLLSEALGLARADLHALRSAGHADAAARYEQAADRWLQMATPPQEGPMNPVAVTSGGR